MKTTLRSAFTLVEFMIVILIVAVLAALATFSVLHARDLTNKNLCLNHRARIEQMKQVWAIQNERQIDAVPVDSDLFGPNGYIKVKPECPANGRYTLGAATEPVICSAAGHD